MTTRSGPPLVSALASAAWRFATVVPPGHDGVLTQKVAAPASDADAAMTIARAAARGR
jgi:hypothetical protein